MNPITQSLSAVPLSAMPTMPAVKYIMRNFQPSIHLPPRGATGPVSIGALLEPLQRIIRHPDRNRLLAVFFNEG